MKRRLLSALFALLLLCPCLPRAARADVPGLSVTSVTFELGVILNIEIRESRRSMAGYYFGVIPDQPAPDNYDWYAHTDPVLRVTKFPGTYYLWLRDTEGAMYGPTKVEMPETYLCYFNEENTAFPPCALSEYLPTLGYSVEELNALVAENVARAGVYTREAAVVGVTTYLSKLQELGIRIPFFFYGYWPVREYGWYANPDWGTVYDSRTEYDVIRGWRDAEHERGTHCNGFVHYVFRLAALNVRNFGDMGETGNIGGIARPGDNQRSAYQGRAGDVLQSCTKHEMFIIDKYDDDRDGWSDGYIVVESNDTEGGQVYCKKPFDTYSRACRVFDMDGVYLNTSTLGSRLRFWQNFHIPQEDWPAYLADAVETHTAYHVYFIDSQGVRTVRVPFRGTADVPEIRGAFAALQTWDTDLTGVALERNYVVRAVPADNLPPLAPSSNHLLYFSFQPYFSF